jgi:hypothetical protein
MLKGHRSVFNRIPDPELMLDRLSNSAAIVRLLSERRSCSAGAGRAPQLK